MGNSKSLLLSPTTEGIFYITSSPGRLDCLHDLSVSVQAPNVEGSPVHHRNPAARQVVKELPVARPQVARLECRRVEQNGGEGTVHQNGGARNVGKEALISKHVVRDLERLPHYVQRRRLVRVREKRNAREHRRWYRVGRTIVVGRVSEQASDELKQRK